MNEYGQKLRLELHELQMLTPVATITRQQGFYVHVRLKMQGKPSANQLLSTPHACSVKHLWHEFHM